MGPDQDLTLRHLYRALDAAQAVAEPSEQQLRTFAVIEEIQGETGNSAQWGDLLSRYSDLRLRSWGNHFTPEQAILLADTRAKLEDEFGPRGATAISVAWSLNSDKRAKYSESHPQTPPISE